MKHPLAFLLLLSLAAAAISGWAYAAHSQPAPGEDLGTIAEMADRVMPDGERLYVVTVRGEGNQEDMGRISEQLQQSSRFTYMKGHGGYAFTVRHTASGLQAEAETRAWMEYAAAKLQEIGLAGIWNINVQGPLKEGMPIGSVWSLMEQRYSAVPIESYEDAGSYSVSYRSAHLQASINTGGKQMNLQAAAHRSSETNEWRITLGTPVILIEY